MVKRIFLFLLTNLLVLVVFGAVLSVLAAFGVPVGGGSLLGLLIMASVFGFGGAFVSLALSKTMAKWSTGAQVIEHPRSEVELWLVSTVQRQARQAGIGMPEVAIYPSPKVNAFATGMSRNSSLVAVSEGLLHSMRRDEAEAVLAHEVSHIANGDMVTLSLIQGVLNTFVIFLARLLGGLIDNMLAGDDERQGPGIGYFVISFALELVFGVLASVVVMWFSRQREYAADAGAARLVGAGNMVAALRSLQRSAGDESDETLPSNVKAFGIRGGGWMELFSSHPPLEARIERLLSASRAPGPSRQALRA